MKKVECIIDTNSGVTLALGYVSKKYKGLVIVRDCCDDTFWVITHGLSGIRAFPVSFNTLKEAEKCMRVLENMYPDWYIKEKKAIIEDYEKDKELQRSMTRLYQLYVPKGHLYI